MKNYLRAVKGRLLKLGYGGFSRMNKSYMLMFHNIGDFETSVNDYQCNNDDFIKYVSYLKNSRGICDIEKAVEGCTSMISISFDDGYCGVYDIAMSFLIPQNIPFTVFVTTSFLNSDNYLSVNQLIEMDKSGLCTIGSHTKSHKILSLSGDSFDEIFESKKQLEKILNHSVDYFAYPYGTLRACSNKNRREVKHAGYKYGFSTIPGVFNAFSRMNKTYLPRVNGDPEVLKFMRR